MKKIIFSLLFWAATSFLFAQTITISFNFAGIEAGYDHKTRCILYLDGVEIATSSVTSETRGGEFTAKIPVGVHVLKIVNFAQYEGNWEAHTIENGYSQDCQFESVVNFQGKKSKLNLDLVFDLNAGTTFELSGKKFAVVN